MLKNFLKAKADVELFVIKFVADLRKSGEESATMELFCFNAIDRDAGGHDNDNLSTSLR